MATAAVNTFFVGMLFLLMLPLFDTCIFLFYFFVGNEYAARIKVVIGLFFFFNSRIYRTW